MKSLLGTFLFFISLNSFSYAVFECKSRDAIENKHAIVQVDRTSPYTPFTNMRIFGVEDGNQTYFKTKTATLITPSTQFYEIRYFGNGLDLKIDIFPDNSPRFGSIYNAIFSDMDLFGGMMFDNMRCEYLY